MEKTVKKERRKYTRVPVKLLPLVNISPNQDPQVLFQGNIVEISEGGALVQLRDLEIANYIPTLKDLPKDSPLPLHGDFLWLYFSLPHQKIPIKTSAELIRVQDQCQLALQFLDLPDPDRKQIRKFVDKK